MCVSVLEITGSNSVVAPPVASVVNVVLAFTLAQDLV